MDASTSTSSLLAADGGLACAVCPALHQVEFGLCDPSQVDGAARKGSGATRCVCRSREMAEARLRELYLLPLLRWEARHEGQRDETRVPRAREGWLMRRRGAGKRVHERAGGILETLDYLNTIGVGLRI